MEQLFTDEYYMRKALEEAKLAFQEDEVPVGCIIVCNNKIVARAHNLTERLNDVTAHAEMQAITAAANLLGGKYLTECVLYVTVEPCVMCAGAIAWAQVTKVVWGTRDEKRGYSNINQQVLHPKTQVVSGVLEAESGELMKRFFAEKRR